MVGRSRQGAAAPTSWLVLQSRVKIVSTHFILRNDHSSAQFYKKCDIDMSI